jgi:hypothetical protein
MRSDIKIDHFYEIYLILPEMMEGGDLLTITVLVLAHLIIGKCDSFYFEYLS